MNQLLNRNKEACPSSSRALNCPSIPIGAEDARFFSTEFAPAGRILTPLHLSACDLEATKPLPIPGSRELFDEASGSIPTTNDDPKSGPSGPSRLLRVTHGKTGGSEAKVQECPLSLFGDAILNLGSNETSHEQFLKLVNPYQGSSKPSQENLFLPTGKTLRIRIISCSLIDRLFERRFKS